MVTAKKRGAPASASKAMRPKRDYEAERLARIQQRQSKREANRKKLDEARVKLGDVAGRVLAEPMDRTPRTKPEYLTEEQLLRFEAEVVAGTPVKQICQKYPDLCNEFDMWTGIADERSKLFSAYARGKQKAVARIEEDILTTSITPMLGITTIRGQRVTKDGDVVDVEEVREADMLGHRTLVVDTLKWQLAHIRPKKHGRNPDAGGSGVNPQLQALFDSIKNGPAKMEEDEE